MLGFALPNFRIFTFPFLSAEGREARALSRLQLRQTFLLVAFASFLRKKTPLLWGEPWGMLAAHVRRGAGRSHRVLPRLPRTAVPACLIPFSPLSPPNPHRSEHSPGQGKGSAEPPLPARPRPGLGPLLRPPPSPRGNERPLCFAASFICVWKGSTAPFPSKNNEIWDKLRSVCLSSVLWLILCGYKCSYFIILICNRLLLAVSPPVAVGTGVHMERIWEMPNYTHRRTPLPKSRSPPDFPLPHLRLSEGSGVIAPCESWERGWIC